MQLEHILLFYKISNVKSISKVAAANHISQPALSQQMQRLEEEVGQRLLERSNRGIELTRAGVVMQKYAEQFLQVYENFQRDMQAVQNSLGSIHIAATPVAANYALPCSLFKVKQHFPDCSFTLNAVHSHQVIQRVENGGADIGFIAGDTPTPGLVRSEAFSDKIYLVAKGSYNIAEKIGLDDLYQHPLVMLNPEFSSYRLVHNYLLNHGVAVNDLHIMCHLDSTESVKSAVLGQQGLAFLPYMAIKKEIYQKQLKIVQLENFDMNCDVYSIHRPREKIGNDELYAIIKYFITTVNKSIC